jgi:C_GCAxxG_C_C family probable redox protein
MSKREKAKLMFSEGFNCAQSVLGAFAQDFGMKPGEAHKVATAFGAGIARTGATCGAVTGALMVLGLREGMKKSNDASAREKTYADAAQFIQTFKRKHGSTECRTLIGCDLSRTEVRRKATEDGMFKSVCAHLVASAASILEEMEKPHEEQ